jgi:hypothetical protein
MKSVLLRFLTKYQFFVRKEEREKHVSYKTLRMESPFLLNLRLGGLGIG